MQRIELKASGAGPTPLAVAGQGPAIIVRGLVKAYGSHRAVDGIDLEVKKGEIFAFLGPNGAGKTTTVEILEGFRHRTGGEVSVLGIDPAEADGAWRNRVGAVLQESQPEPGLTVCECLDLYAGYYSNPRDIDETIKLVGLEEKAGAKAEHLADRIAVIAEGRIVAQGTPETLGGRDRLGATITFSLPSGVPFSDLPLDLQLLATRGAGRALVLHSQSPLAHVHWLGDWAITAGVDLPDLEVRRRSLEEVYLSLTDNRKESK